MVTTSKESCVVREKKTIEKNISKVELEKKSQ